MQTIDLTPTWEEIVPTMVHVLLNTDNELAKQAMRDELIRAGKLADMYGQAVKDIEALEQQIADANGRKEAMRNEMLTVIAEQKTKKDAGAGASFILQGLGPHHLSRVEDFINSFR
jgi:hypothetical protein